MIERGPAGKIQVMRPWTWVLIAFLPGPTRGEESWRDLAPLPTPRQEVGVALAGGKIYCLGGIRSTLAATTTVERYDPVRDAWEEVAPLPRALHHVGAAALEGKVYVLGGLDDAFNGVSSCYRYDPDRNTWEDQAPLSTPRGAPGAAVLEGRIYLAGGQRGGTTVREFAAFTPGAGAGSWEALPDMPTARNHLAAAAVGGFFYAISGRNNLGLSAQVERYDPRARAWSSRSPIRTPRGGIAAAALGDRIYVFGGEGNRAVPSGVFPQTELYDAALDRWSPRLDMSVPRHGIGAAALAGLIYIPGGSEVQGFGVTAASTAYRPPDEDLLPHSFLRGDANDDGKLDLADALAILFSLFLAGPSAPCPDARDADDSGVLDLSDAVRLLEHLFLGGPVLPPPGPPAGPDPTADFLGC